jgi:hypothetical protein
MRRPFSVVGRHVLVLCVSIFVCSAAYAEEKVQTPPDEQLLTPVTDTALSPSTIVLPSGDLFKPLIADPKEPRFYLSYRIFKFGSDQTHAAVGGYGEFFGLYRHVDTCGGYSWQANFGGGAHAQFNLHAPSLDLVNTDYTVGFPFSFRRGSASFRLAIFHQSSHLGDEYLLHNNISERVELSYEAVEVIGSYEWTTWRVYYGLDYIIHQGPTNIKPAALQGGVEYYGTSELIGKGRPVGGWDLKSDQTHDWSLNSSVKVGLQFDSSIRNGHFIRVLAEGYKGFNPYGQFYVDRSMYAGIGVYLGFE